MVDSHFGAIASVGALVLGGVTLLWHVLRAFHGDMSRRFDTLSTTMTDHVTTDATIHATHAAQLKNLEERIKDVA